MRTLAHDGSAVPEPTCPDFCWEPVCGLTRQRDSTIGRDVDHRSQPRHVIVPSAQGDHRLVVSIEAVDELEMQHPRHWVRNEPEVSIDMETTSYFPQDPKWRPAWEQEDRICMNLADLDEHIAGLQRVRDELASIAIPAQRKASA